MDLYSKEKNHESQYLISVFLQWHSPFPLSGGIWHCCEAKASWKNRSRIKANKADALAKFQK